MLLRIVTWNCHEALHKKYEHLLALRPDIAVVQECEEPDVLRRKASDFAFSDCEWRTMPRDAAGRRGLGVFAFGEHRLRLRQSWKPEHLLFLPVEVRGGGIPINLLGVWAFNRRTKTVTPSPRTTADAISHYADFLRATSSVVAGDFNASLRWEGKRNCASFVALDESLRELGLTSVYHAKHGHGFDREPEPTLCFQWNEEKPFHIDYIYAPSVWMPGLQSVSVGAAADWVGRKLSDHMPLTAEWELPRAAARGSVAGLGAGALPLTARA